MTTICCRELLSSGRPGNSGAGLQPGSARTIRGMQTAREIVMLVHQEEIISKYCTGRFRPILDARALDHCFESVTVPKACQKSGAAASGRRIPILAGGVVKPVIGAESAQHAPDPVGWSARDFAWYLLGWSGLVYILVGGIDILLAWYPIEFGNAEWEFGTISATLDRLPLATVGAMFILAAGVARGIPWLVRLMSVLLI